MKRLLLLFCCAFFLTSVAPIPVISAQDPQSGQPEHKSKLSKLMPFHHHKDHQAKSSSSKSSTKTVSSGGHSGPGPAGAGTK